MSDAKPFSDKQIDSINELLKTNNHYRFEYYLLEDDGKRETRINADTDTVRRFLAPIAARDKRHEETLDIIEEDGKTIAARDTELNAWKTAFGNQQLTHAIAQRDADRKRIEKLNDKITEITDGFFAMEKALDAARGYLTAEEHEQVKKFVTLQTRLEKSENYNEVLKGLRAEEAEDYEALQKRLERMEGATIPKELLLKYLDQRIRYYGESKIPDQPRSYNDAIVNAYEWLKQLVEKNKLESATDESACQALKEKPKGEE